MVSGVKIFNDHVEPQAVNSHHVLETSSGEQDGSQKEGLGSGRWSTEVPLGISTSLPLAVSMSYEPVLFLSPSELPSHFGYVINLAFNLS